MTDTDTDEVFNCKSCKECFKSLGSLESHRKKVHVKIFNKAYVCQYCKKVFQYPTNLKQHLRIHDGSTPFSCSECSMSFNQKISLDNHILKEHMGKGLYCCPICNAVTSYAQGFRRHMATSHREKYLDNGTKSLCNLCWYVFDTEQELADHRVQVHRKHQCQICEKNFKSSSHLKEHLLTHLNVQPYKCGFCPNLKGFVRQSYLTQHIKRHHSSEELSNMDENPAQAQETFEEEILGP